MILGIDHVGIAVLDLAGAAARFERLTGGHAGDAESLPAHAARVCFIAIDRATQMSERSALPVSRLELIAPLADGALSRSITRRGEGMHHVCFAVDDVEQELSRLIGQGFVPIDPQPRRGHGGLVAFLHPASAGGVLVELLQRDPDPLGRPAGGPAR